MTRPSNLADTIVARLVSAYRHGGEPLASRLFDYLARRYRIPRTDYPTAHFAVMETIQ